MDKATVRRAENLGVGGSTEGLQSGVMPAVFVLRTASLVPGFAPVVT